MIRIYCTLDQFLSMNNKYVTKILNYGTKHKIIIRFTFDDGIINDR